MYKLDRRDRRIVDFLESGTLFRIKSSHDSDGGWSIFHGIWEKLGEDGKADLYHQRIRLKPDVIILLLKYEFDPEKFLVTPRERVHTDLMNYCQLDFLYEEKVIQAGWFHKGSIRRTLERANP